MLKLYQIPGAMTLALEKVGEDGELTDDVLAELDTLNWTFAERVEACCQVRQSYVRAAESVKAEIDRLSALKHSLDGSAERMKGYIRQGMEQTGQRKVEGFLFKCWLQKNGQPSLGLAIKPENLPTAYQRVRTVVEIDRDALIDAWKSGGTLPEGVTIAVGEHLRIK